MHWRVKNKIKRRSSAQGFQYFSQYLKTGFDETKKCEMCMRERIKI